VERSLTQWTRASELLYRRPKQAHCPTYPITLAEFIELLVVEFDVQTRVSREAALAILHSARLISAES